MAVFSAYSVTQSNLIVTGTKNIVNVEITYNKGIVHLAVFSIDNKIRSHAHAVTDWIYCPEPLGSPRPQATGCPGVLGSKSSQLLFGRDFLILFHHFL